MARQRAPIAQPVPAALRDGARATRFSRRTCRPTCSAAPQTIAVETAWTESLRHWARRELAAGGSELFGRAQEELERVLIDCALDQTGGQRLKAAELLGARPQHPDP